MLKNYDSDGISYKKYTSEYEEKYTVDRVDDPLIVFNEDKYHRVETRDNKYGGASYESKYDKYALDKYENKYESKYEGEKYEGEKYTEYESASYSKPSEYEAIVAKYQSKYEDIGANTYTNK